MTTWFALSLRLPQAHTLEAGQHFLDKIGQLVIVGNEAEAEPVEASIREFLELAGDRIGITDRERPTIARAIARAQLFRLRARHRPLIGGTEIEVEHGVNGAVIAVLDREIAKVLVGLPLRRPAHHRARGEDLDRLAELAGDVPHTQDAVARLLEVVRLVEHQVAMARTELASRDRIAGVHQDGPPPAPGQWPAGDALQSVVATIVIERRLLRPEAEEDLEPFLAAGVAVVMHILLDPEHVELRLVP